MSDMTMQPPPCADHGYNRLDCPECGDARRVYYLNLERELEELEATDPAVAEAAARLDETTTAIVGKAREALRCPDCPALFTHPDTLLQHAVKRARAATNQVVARSGGRACHTCGQEIRRGEAYVYLDPEATPDDLAHVRCPDVGDRPTYGPGSTVRTRDDDGNDHAYVVDEAGRPTPTPKEATDG